jgi:hypothetical protein
MIHLQRKRLVIETDRPKASKMKKLSHDLSNYSEEAESDSSEIRGYCQDTALKAEMKKLAYLQTESSLFDS